MKTRNIIGLLSLLVAFVVVAIVARVEGEPEDVLAATACTWQGGVSSNWFDAANWTDCFDEHSAAKVPGNLDAVLVGAGVTYNPRFDGPSQPQVSVGSLTVDPGGLLAINTKVEFVATQFDNSGTITVGGEDYYGFKVYATFNNDGTVDAGSGFASLNGSGTHSGDFIGHYVNFGIQAPSPVTATFQTSSSIDVDTAYFSGGGLFDINGSFDCGGSLYVRKEGTRVTIAADNLVDLGTPIVDADAELVIEMDGTVTGSLDVASGAVMTGTGTIDGDLINAGTLSPGASPGTIGVTSVYTQEETGVMAIELGGTKAGTGYDQVVVTGTATLSGTLEVTLIDSFVPSQGDTFEILRYGNREGEFHEVNLPQLDPSYILNITYGTNSALLTVAKTGIIRGTVTYDGSLPAATEIKVALFSNYPTQGPPVDGKTIATPGGSYAFADLTDGDYYVLAFIDLNNSGEGPSLNEPSAWHDANEDGAPDAITITNSATVADIDLTLHDKSLIFLPIVVRATP